jgi:hypothetical protein
MTGDVQKVLAEHEYFEGMCTKCRELFEIPKWENYLNHLRPLLAASAAPTPEPTGAEWDKAVQACYEKAKATRFRAHGDDDVDYRSGCEQTQWRICQDILKLKGKFTLAAQPGQKGED